MAGLGRSCLTEAIRNKGQPAAYPRRARRWLGMERESGGGQSGSTLTAMSISIIRVLVTTVRCWRLSTDICAAAEFPLLSILRSGACAIPLTATTVSSTSFCGRSFCKRNQSVRKSTFGLITLRSVVQIRSPQPTFLIDRMLSMFATAGTAALLERCRERDFLRSVLDRLC
jgi:hypothetical protein